MPAARPVVVLVEDEELIRRLLERVLESAEYEVVVAPNGEVAIGLIERRAGELALLVPLVAVLLVLSAWPASISHHSFAGDSPTQTIAEQFK